jgi:hypothetical protein
MKEDTLKRVFCRDQNSSQSVLAGTSEAGGVCTQQKSDVGARHRLDGR